MTSKAYYFPPGRPTWPFGYYSCRIVIFYPCLFYATSWLLLAISLERARAIYYPFKDKLKTHIVVVLSSVIILSSVALEMRKESGTIMLVTNTYTSTKQSMGIMTAFMKTAIKIN